MSTIEIVISSISIIIVGLLLASNVTLRLNNRKLLMKAMQSEADRLTVYKKTQDLLAEEAEQMQTKDGFVKFMSQSRDWAFEYIEKVQDDMYYLKELFENIGTGAKTVAQANDLNARIERVLSNLPDDKKKDK